ncbi:MAG: ATP synthase F0 subunit B [Desulfosarcina sp.]|nr:ATP synthase F0 subunit B [Desulfosarcina sp.]
MGPAYAMMLFVGFFIGLFPESAVAADPGWRPTYDVAMRWVNFIILVAIIVKYAREPIKDFLKLQKGDVASQIDELDREKAKILGEIKAAKKKGVENQVRFKEFKDRLIAQGETRKQQIIEQAKQQSAIMLDGARRKIEGRIVQAKASLKMELLDMAMDQAVNKLPELITEGDSQRLLDDYMRSLQP